MENPIKMDDLGENPLFSETSISSSSPSPWKVFFFDSNIIFNLPAVIKHKHALQRTLRFFWPPNLNNPADPNWEWNLSKDQVEHFKQIPWTNPSEKYARQIGSSSPQFFGLKQFTKNISSASS